MLEIRKAADQNELDAVCRLAHDEYVRQGYIQPLHGHILRHYRHLDNIPETTVLIAVEDGQIIGTNSYTVDGRAGLHVDCDFPDETAAVRKECRETGKTLGASWRIVTGPQARNRRDVLMRLIDETLTGMCKLGCRSSFVVLFSFNDKHERIYQRLLGLQTIARGKCLSLDAPPAVLMRGDCHRMLDCWGKHRNHPFPLDCPTRPLP